MAILHAEFQRRHDADIGRRVWEYNVLTECLKQVPVYSFVIYLVKDSGIVQPPYRRVLLDGSVSHVFYYTNVYLWELPTSAFKGPGREGLLPLLPLTKNGARREVVEEMIEELQAVHRQDLLAMAYSFAALALQGKADRNWLRRRFEMLSDILEDSWAFQELKQRAKVQAEREVAQEVEQIKRELAQQLAGRIALAEQEMTEKVALAEQEMAEKVAQEVAWAREEIMQDLDRRMYQRRLAQERRTLERYVQSRFPTLLSLLQEQTKGFQNPDSLRELLFTLFAVRSEDEARSMILTARDQAE